MSTPRSLVRPAAGFTLVESLIVIAVLGIAALLGVPAFLDMLRRERLVGSAREAATLMRLARSQAVKTNRRAGVTMDFARNEVVAFADRDGSGAYEATDQVLGRYVLPNGISMFGPGDDIDGEVHNNANVGFPENADGEGTVLFSSLGAASTSGAFRFTDAGVNYLEARVDPPATGRVSVQKHAGGSDVPGNWFEQGEDGNEWEWSEEGG